MRHSCAEPAPQWISAGAPGMKTAARSTAATTRSLRPDRDVATPDNGTFTW